MTVSGCRRQRLRTTVDTGQDWLKQGDNSVTLANILWLVLVVLVVLWLVGLVGNIGGGLIHILIVVAVIILLYNLLVGRRAV